MSLYFIVEFSNWREIYLLTYKFEVLFAKLALLKIFFKRMDIILSERTYWRSWIGKQKCSNIIEMFKYIYVSLNNLPWKVIGKSAQTEDKHYVRLSQNSYLLLKRLVAQMQIQAISEFGLLSSFLTDLWTATYRQLHSHEKPASRDSQILLDWVNLGALTIFHKWHLKM